MSLPFTYLSDVRLEKHIETAYKSVKFHHPCFSYTLPRILELYSFHFPDTFLSPGHRTLEDDLKAPINMTRRSACVVYVSSVNSVARRMLYALRQHPKNMCYSAMVDVVVMPDIPSDLRWKWSTTTQGCRISVCHRSICTSLYRIFSAIQVYQAHLLQLFYCA